MVKRQAEWLEAMEKRIGATGTMLGSMKRVKMCGLSGFLFEAIHSLRKHELHVSKGFRRLLIGSMFFAFTTPIIAPVLSFMVFSLVALRSNGQSALSVGTAYTSLSLFALLAEPLSSLIMAMTAFAGSVGCFARIQAFLESDEHVDKRSKPYQRSFDGSDDSLDSNESKSSEETITTENKMAKYTFTEKFLRRRFRNDSNVLQIEEGSFGWDTDKEPLLSSIDISIPRDKLTMIVGPVGCGKTTLLKALLGEVPTLSGSVHLSMHSHISYCEQSSFHMNGTIQDSITAFTHFDERWYSTVVEACALDEDLQQLPLADQTRIGSKGVALSGGQCQRLALARAVYARNDICILDDVLSGLDMDTEGRVFHNLLGPDGLLRQHNSTVILASSSNKRIPFADHIIVLDDKGHVAEQGSFKELTASGGHISGLDLPPADWKPKGNEASLDRLMSSTTRFTFTPRATKLPEDTMELEANQRTGDISIYVYYARSVGWYAVVAFFLAMCGYVFCYTFPQVWVGWWADANAEHPNADLGYWLGIYAVLGVGGLICLVISCWQIIVTMVPQSGANFHKKLLDTVLSAPMAFFTTTDTGVTLNRFSQDLQLIDMDLPISALNFFTALLLCLAQIILIGVTTKYAAVSFPFWFVALYFIQKFYLRTSRQLRFLDLEAKSPLYTQFTETLAGLTTVRAFGWQRALERQNRRMLDDSQKPFYLLWSVQRWLQLVLDFLVTGVAVMLIILVVELRGKLFGAYIGIAFLNVILFSQNLKLVLQYWTMLETHIGAITRIKNFTKAVASENLPGESSDKLPPQWPARGSISFQNVSASYDGTRKVLKDVNMTIAPGEKVAICGRTGSGKSSLTLALFRMIELSSGTITIDDIDISTASRQEIRSRIIGLPQDVLLLPGSVRTNIDPYGSADDATIITTLQDVHLWHRIEAKGGLDADIETVKLSHGQKQLFCLAQALLRKSSILVLDEATSRLVFLFLISLFSIILLRSIMMHSFFHAICPFSFSSIFGSFSCAAILKVFPLFSPSRSSSSPSTPQYILLFTISPSLLYPSVYYIPLFTMFSCPSLYPPLHPVPDHPYFPSTAILFQLEFPTSFSLHQTSHIIPTSFSDNPSLTLLFFQPSVDDTTDALIQRLIRTKFAHHTILTVAHKLDTIADYDRVLVLDKCSMREFDGPNELLAQKGSVFRALWESYGGSFAVGGTAADDKDVDEDVVTDDQVYGSKASTEVHDDVAGGGGTENRKEGDSVKGRGEKKPRS